mgnify:CR=1 FL=1
MDDAGFKTLITINLPLIFSFMSLLVWATNFTNFHEFYYYKWQLYTI